MTSNPMLLVKHALRLQWFATIISRMRAQPINLSLPDLSTGAVTTWV